MKCPLCSNQLYSKNNALYCQRTILLDSCDIPITHYKCVDNKYGQYHNMIVFPFQIATHYNYSFDNNRSFIYKYSIKGFELLLDTPAITPTNETALRNRLGTILVFS